MTVRETPLAAWIARGEGGHYVIKRLKDADKVLAPEAVWKLKQAAAEFAGRPYDWTFEWSDDRLYCSELLWKIYERGLGIRIGKLERLRDFDLADPVVKAILDVRFGNSIPLNEQVVSPAAIFSSGRLVLVVER